MSGEPRPISPTALPAPPPHTRAMRGPWVGLACGGLAQGVGGQAAMWTSTSQEPPSSARKDTDKGKCCLVGDAPGHSPGVVDQV